MKAFSVVDGCMNNIIFNIMKLITKIMFILNINLIGSKLDFLAK